MISGPTLTVVFEHCTVFDGASEQLLDNSYVTVVGERIADISRKSPTVSAARRVNCAGRVLMPGLIDAHVHACAPSFSFYSNDRLPPSLLAIQGAMSLRNMLARGFTTVRDAGGADHGLAMAVERGVIEGPRLFFSGKAISQTGGHGDMRPSEHVEPCRCSQYSGSISLVADGPDAVRAAVREQLRQGATQIKIFVSGGVSSPTDPLWMNQFSDLEIQAAVEEAASRRTYVMAHCHTDEGARRCVRLGIRTIEHGTEIEDSTARSIADKDMYVVPTLSVVDVLRKNGNELGLPESGLRKAAGMYERMARSIETCARAGVKLGLGTDLLGQEYQDLQAGELALRGEIQKPIDVLRSATSINAALLKKPGELGCVAPNALADLLVLNGDPLQDLSIFHRIPVVMKGGTFIRCEL